LRELARWNDAHAEAALKFGQSHVLKALDVDHERERAAYLRHRARDLAVAGEHGIDATLEVAQAAAIVVPGWHGEGQAARAGYPSLVVPAGYRPHGRAPVGLTFLGPRGSEALLLALAAAYEEASQARRAPSVINPSLQRGVAGSAATG
jgi:amidase